MATKSGENRNVTPFHWTLLYYPVAQKFAQNRSRLSLTVFEIFTLFHLPQKSKMATKSGENPNFTPLHRTLLYYPAGQKFTQDHSISYSFQDIHTFSFSAKIQDGRQKWQKLKLFAFAQDTLALSCGSKLHSKLLYLLRFTRYSHFFICCKNPRWLPKVAKIEIFPLSTGHSCTTLRVKNSLEIALSVTVFKIFTLFHFPQKSKMVTKNRNFTPLHWTLFYDSVGKKFTRNRSISYGFGDIHTFSYFVKKQDGRQKW